jgi:hypothetical protein
MDAGGPRGVRAEASQAGDQSLNEPDDLLPCALPVGTVRRQPMPQRTLAVGIAVFASFDMGNAGIPALTRSSRSNASDRWRRL